MDNHDRYLIDRYSSKIKGSKAKKEKCHCIKKNERKKNTPGITINNKNKNHRI
jgi:hypothetical protein